MGTEKEWTEVPGLFHYADMIFSYRGLPHAKYF